MLKWSFVSGLNPFWNLLILVYLCEKWDASLLLGGTARQGALAYICPPLHFFLLIIGHFSVVVVLATLVTVDHTVWGQLLTPPFFNHCIFKINSSYWSTAWAEAVNTTEFSASKHDFCCFYINLYVLFLLCILYVSFLTYFSFCWFCLSDVNLNFLYTNLSCHFERSAKYLF